MPLWKTIKRSLKKLKQELPYHPAILLLGIYLEKTLIHWKQVYCQGWNRSPAQVGGMRQALGPGALGKPRESGWRGRWEGGSGWGTHVNPWLFHSNVWQNSLQIKKKIIKKRKKKNSCNLYRGIMGNCDCLYFHKVYIHTFFPPINSSNEFPSHSCWKPRFEGALFQVCICVCSSVCGHAHSQQKVTT